MAHVALYDRAADVPAQLARLWQPHDGPQTEFLKRREFEAAYGGAKGGGKTDAILYGGLRQIHHPHYHAAFFRRDYPELQEVMDRAALIFPQLGGVWNEQKKRWVFPSGARYSFFYCKRLGDERKHNGKEYQYLGIDQLEEYDEGQYTFLIGCCRSSRPGLRVEVRTSFNPGGPGHLFCKTRFHDLGSGISYRDPTTGLTRVFIQAKVWDNPTLMQNDPGYVQRLMNLSDPALRKAYLEGDMNVFAGQYFAEWREEIHVRAPDHGITVPPEWPRRAGLDWGHSPDPGVFLLAAEDPFGRIEVYRELCYRMLAPTALGHALADLLATEHLTEPLLIRADTQMWTTLPGHSQSMAEDVNQVLHDRGINAALMQANKDRINGWARVHDYLDPRRPYPDDPGGHGPWLKVWRPGTRDPRGAPYLLTTLPAQIHHHRQNGDLEPSRTDHAVDALRYLLMDCPSPPPVEEPVTPTAEERARQRRVQLLMSLMERQQEADGEAVDHPLPTYADPWPATPYDPADGITWHERHVADLYGS